MAELIIACLSQKGGVGKSTLSRLVARTYAVAGWTVKIADFNGTQQTSLKWATMRRQNGIEPTIAAEEYNQPTALKRENFDLVVADGRPDSVKSSLDIARVSDLVIIPTGLALDDLEPQLAFAKELVEKGVEQKRIMFVLSKITDSKVAINEAREFLSEFQVADQNIELKHSYQKSQNHGYALSEVQGLNTSRLEEVADLLAAEIVETVNRLGAEK